MPMNGAQRRGYTGADLQNSNQAVSFGLGAILSTNGASEKMWVDLANAIDIRRHSGVLETCARKSTPPLFCSQKARIRANFRICLDVCKTIQNLKHQLRIDRLIIVRPHTFADHQPAIGGESRASFIQAKQKILGDMHHVDGVYEIELSRGEALSVPWQVEV